MRSLLVLLICAVAASAGADVTVDTGDPCPITLVKEANTVKPAAIKIVSPLFRDKDDKRWTGMCVDRLGKAVNGEWKIGVVVPAIQGERPIRRVRFRVCRDDECERCGQASADVCIIAHTEAVGRFE